MKFNSIDEQEQNLIRQGMYEIERVFMRSVSGESEQYSQRGDP